MNYLMKLSVWTIGASLAVVGIYAWLPDWIRAVGVLVGFLSVVQVLKIRHLDTCIQDGLLLAVFLLISVLSYLTLRLFCHFLPYMNQCQARAQNALLIANVGFIGSPILAFYLGVRIPMLLRKLKKE